MKRAALILVLAIIGAMVSAQSVYYESTPTLAWDAVTADVDGNAFLSSDIVEYELYLWDMAGGDPTSQPVTALNYLGLTGATEYVMGFPHRAEWACAIRTKHVDGGGSVSYSALAYSVVEADTATGAFVIIPVLVWLPAKVKGLGL